MKSVIVVPYNKSWPGEFEKIRKELAAELGECAVSIEHVGSTSVEGLAAKPVIDIDIMIKSYNCFEEVKSELVALGYLYQGDLGIPDRQAFKCEGKPHLMKHHLYVCPEYSAELERHIAFRDFLRKNDAERDLYAKVKIMAAKHYPDDIDSYMKAKNPWCKEILERCNLQIIHTGG